MPYQTESTPFTGDDDLGDFFLDVWEPFANTVMGWVANRAPAVGTRPKIQVWTHRGSVGSPEAPYIFIQTLASHFFTFTGTGVDTGEEIYDQPGNPANAPQHADFETGLSTITNIRCGFFNSLLGPYQAYWLFGDTAGSYIHLVLKVAARQYRHFHVGLLSPVHSGLSDQSFYVTPHFWQRLGPDGFSISGSDINNEHAPYDLNHVLPFSHGRTTVKQRQFANKFYIPGLRGDLTSDFYLPDSSNSGTLAAVTKPIGSVNTSGYIHGVAQVSGYGNGLGSILLHCNRTFTSHMVPLIPIYVGVNTTFDSAQRLGVVAQIPDIFRISMRNVEAEEEIAVGAETYVCFPVMNKDSANTLDGEGYSGYEGLAYRKETGAVV